MVSKNALHWIGIALVLMGLFGVGNSTGKSPDYLVTSWVMAIIGIGITIYSYVKKEKKKR